MVVTNQMAINLQAGLNAVQIQAANTTQRYADLSAQMALDHRDQNHTNQVCCNK